MSDKKRIDDILTLPENLPEPKDDGAADHLRGMQIPAITLTATNGASIDLATILGTMVIYCYPRTGLPDVAPPDEWNFIPGARGCTPQSCAFRDHFDEFKQLGITVYGLSTQDPVYQAEAVKRLALPFQLLSDEALKFSSALNLPLFAVHGITLLKRLTLIVKNGIIVKVFYPVFPPNENAANVIAWIKSS